MEQAEDELQEFLSDAGIASRVASLRSRKKDLEHKLFDGDEKLVRTYDEVKALGLEPESVETILHCLITTPQLSSTNGSIWLLLKVTRW